MNIDKARITRYLTEMTKTSCDLEELSKSGRLTPDSIELKAAKYMLVELAEVICNILQHVLAKEKGIAVSGYIDTFVKAYDNSIISDSLFNRLKPFLDFRNSLIHRYWTIEDSLLIKNIQECKTDFKQFIEEIERYMAPL